MLLVHGLLGSHSTWGGVAAALAADHEVIAPDLLGHGASDKPLGDYSMGAYAATLRDLLDELGVDEVTAVGHSLGGGVALQLAYLFPQRVRRLVLVSSGGFGREISVLLRAACLPGARWALPLLAGGWVQRPTETVAGGLSRLGLHGGPDLVEAWRGFASLADAASRRAFLATVRSVLDLGGQVVTAQDRLSRLAGVPTLIVWGDRDRVIPVEHGRLAAELVPQARLEVFAGAGHFPHLDQPERFVALLHEFMAATPADRAAPTSPQPPLSLPAGPSARPALTSDADPTPGDSGPVPPTG